MRILVHPCLSAFRSNSAKSPFNVRTSASAVSMVESSVNPLISAYNIVTLLNRWMYFFDEFIAEGLSSKSSFMDASFTIFSAINRGIADKMSRCWLWYSRSCLRQCRNNRLNIRRYFRSPTRKWGLKFKLDFSFFHFFVPFRKKSACVFIRNDTSALEWTEYSTIENSGKIDICAKNNRKK